MTTRCETCSAPATQHVTVVIDAERDAQDTIVGGRFDSRWYCTRDAAEVAQEIAHGEPPNVELVCVISICRRRVVA